MRAQVEPEIFGTTSIALLARTATGAHLKLDPCRPGLCSPHVLHPDCHSARPIAASVDRRSAPVRLLVRKRPSAHEYQPDSGRRRNHPPGRLCPDSSPWISGRIPSFVQHAHQARPNPRQHGLGPSCRRRTVLRICGRPAGPAAGCSLRVLQARWPRHTSITADRKQRPQRRVSTTDHRGASPAGLRSRRHCAGDAATEQHRADRLKFQRITTGDVSPGSWRAANVGTIGSTENAPVVDLHLSFEMRVPSHSHP